MVITAIEELSATISEIAGNKGKANSITENAVNHAKEISIKVNESGEAARAGGEGKGFAVIAGEIKALTQQTAGATTKINARISGVQQTTSGSVSAIEVIVDVIDDTNEIATTVATQLKSNRLQQRIFHKISDRSAQVLKQ